MSKTRALINLAIKIAGSQQKLAEALGLSQQAVSYYIVGEARVSAEVAVKIDKFTKGKISKAALRPDLFGDAA